MPAVVRITGTVERLFTNDDSIKMIVAVEDGGQYPTRVTVFTDRGFVGQQGDTVTAESARLPYVKERTYTDRDGNEKVAKDLTLPSARLTLGVDYNPTAEPAVTDAPAFSGDIPF